MRVSQAVRCFLRSTEASGRAELTISSYAHKLALLNEITGDVRIIEMTADFLMKAVVKLKRGYPLGKPRSVTSMNQARSIIKSFFTWATSTGLIQQNPSVNLRLARNEQLPPKPILKDDLARLFRIIHEDKSPRARRDEALFALYAYSGVRRKEGLSVRVGDLDLGQDRIWLRGTKTGYGNLRSMPISLRTILDEYIRKSPAPRFRSRNSFLFPGRICGRSLSPRAANMRFNHWKRKANLSPELTIHSFRSGFASHLYGVTRDAILVSHALGHKSLASVNRYISIHELGTRDAIRKAFDDDVGRN
jgi:integrase